METKLLTSTKENILLAAEAIRAGEIVGFPTETVYGLGADALNQEAVAKIFTAKGRPADNPLIAHICTREMGDALAYFTLLAEKLAAAFWPGPLTLVLPRKKIVPDIVSAGLDTVGVRFPSHPIAAALIAAAKTPIAAPSANRSGRPSPTLASHVMEDLAGKIPYIIDGGPVEIGLESTVVDASGNVPVLLRPGRISVEELRAIAGDCLFAGADAGARPAAPGMKYRHYAPKGALYLVEDYRAAEALRLHMLAEAADPPLLLLPDDGADALTAHGVPDTEIIRLGMDKESFAARLFAALREADRRGTSRILVQRVDEAGLGLAIMNRLSKAAAKK